MWKKAAQDKLLDSEQIRMLTLALGTNIGKLFDIEKLRYHRIIIMTDADVTELISARCSSHCFSAKCLS